MKFFMLGDEMENSAGLNLKSQISLVLIFHISPQNILKVTLRCDSKAVSGVCTLR